MSIDPYQNERIDLLEEQAHVTKRQVETGRVRISTVVDVRDDFVTEKLERQALSIERRPIEREVRVAPAPREERNATIISLVEERVTITKTLFVVEELIVRREIVTNTVEIPVSLRAMRAVVEQDSKVAKQEEN